MKRPSSLILVGITNVLLMVSLIFQEACIKSTSHTITLQQDVIQRQQALIHDYESTLTNLVACYNTTNTIHWTNYNYDPR